MTGMKVRGYHDVGVSPEGHCPVEHLFHGGGLGENLISKICQKILITSTDKQTNVYLVQGRVLPPVSQSVSQPVSKKGMELLGQLKNSPCPREDTSPSWKFSHGCCLPTRSSSGSRGRRDSWDEKVKLPGESIFLTISNNIMIT